MIDRKKLEQLLEQHDGVIARVAAALGMPGSTASRLVADLGMDERADQLRGAAHKNGPRPRLVNGRLDEEGERATILGALERNGWNVKVTAAALGRGRRTLFTHMHQLGIERPRPSREKRRVELIEAFIEAGTQAGVAAILEISRMQVYREMRRCGLTMQALQRVRSKILSTTEL